MGATSSTREELITAVNSFYSILNLTVKFPKLYEYQRFYRRQRLMPHCALQTNRFLKLFVLFMFTSIICRELHSLFSSEEMYAFFDKHGYPASVVQAGHHRDQLIDRPSTLQTSQKELSHCDFLVGSALQRSDQHGNF